MVLGICHAGNRSLEWLSCQRVDGDRGFVTHGDVGNIEVRNLNDHAVRSVRPPSAAGSWHLIARADEIAAVKAEECNYAVVR